MISVQPVNSRLRFLVDRIESQIARDYTTRYDQNGNGVVERSEFQGMAEVFQRIDQDQNDRLELSEVKRYVDLLRQREPARNSQAEGETTRTREEQSFRISSHARLIQSMRAYFSDEISNLDTNGNGFLDPDELGAGSAEFSALDTDQNNLVTSREWAEGFIENNTEIQMAIKAYRFSRGIFRTGGGMIQVSA